MPAWLRTTALVLALALGPASGASAAWSPPTTVSVPHDAIGQIALASGTAGDLLSWHVNDLLPPRREIFGPAGARYATAAPNQPFGPEHRWPAAYATAPMVDLGEGRVAQLALRRTGASTSEAQVALGSVDGVFGRSLKIRGAVWSSASLAGDSHGELLLAWISSPRAGHRQVWASVRPAGRPFERPQMISSAADAEQVTAAIGSPAHRTGRHGFAADMAVAFPSRRGRMLVRVRFHGQGWGRTADVGPAAAGSANAAAIDIARNGRVVVAWSHQQLSEGGPLGPGFTSVAVRPPDAHGFLPAQTLERDRDASLTERPVLLSNQGRGLILAFVAQPRAPVMGSSPTVVRAAYSHGRLFGAAQTISPAGQQVSQLAGADGLSNVLVAWSGGPNPPFSALGPGPAIYAASGEPGANRLGPVMQVSPDEQAEAPTPIYSLAAGRWTVAWRGHPLYRSPTDRGAPVVRVATCPGTCP